MSEEKSAIRGIQERAPIGHHNSEGLLGPQRGETQAREVAKLVVARCPVVGEVSIDCPIAPPSMTPLSGLMELAQFLQGEGWGGMRTPGATLISTTAWAKAIQEIPRGKGSCPLYASFPCYVCYLTCSISLPLMVLILYVSGNRPPHGLDLGWVGQLREGECSSLGPGFLP